MKILARENAKIPLFLRMNFQQAHLNFQKWSESITVPLTGLFPSVQKNDVVSIDLSKNNTIVKTEKEFNNPEYFATKLEQIQSQHPTKIIAGGYLEKRALYTSDLYNSKNSTAKRNVHLGVDFWLPNNTPIHSPLEGRVVCSVHQEELKGYGGFVILKHQFDAISFFSLYGHLSKESITKYKTGDIVKSGQKIGELGTYEENGEWVPHLHFQIMLDLLDYTNDFPGVVLESEVDYWKHVCPNPNLLFQLEGLKRQN